MQKKNKITMGDIAREAGVSQATVSLVLNNSRTIRLSDATRERVFAAAKSLGYQKMSVAHRPEGQEEVAMLISGMPGYDPFGDALSEASATAWQQDTLLSVYDYGDDIELARHILRQLDKRRCAGVLALCRTDEFTGCAAQSVRSCPSAAADVSAGRPGERLAGHAASARPGRHAHRAHFRR